MEPLIYEGAEDTPKVSLDADSGKLEFSGNSLPENAVQFYKPVFEWLDEYVKSPSKLTSISFKMNYFNSASSKIIMDLLDTVVKINQNTGNQIEVIWGYYEDDSDMLDAGKEYSELVETPFQYLELK
jgi:hypothetical protein